MLIPRILRVCLLALALEAVGPAQVLINEVLYRLDPSNSDPLKTQQWVELFNTSGNPVDLTGWIVSGRDGSAGASARTLPSVSIPGGGYVVVHLASGTDRLDFSDGTGDTYTQDAGPVWSTDMDEVALYSPNGIVDFIAWGDNAIPYSPGSAHGDAVAAGIWTPNAALASDGITVLEYERPRPVAPGMSVGRDPDSTDTDTPADFEPHGGVGALDNSPNRQNLDQINIVEVDPPAAAGGNSRKEPRASAPHKKWTVMLYFNADNSLEKYIYGNVQEIEAAGGSDDNVNFVVMYDGKRFSRGTQRGLIRAGDPLTMTLEHALGESAQIGERDMGDPNELAGFIAWAKASYPADHYALILSAHGDSWKSYGPDETSVGTYGSDYLFMGELSSALTGQHFDLIGFDACLMAGIEVADQIRDFTDYYVASEQTIPGYGFPYDTFVAGLKQNPNWTGLNLGSQIVQLYAARYNNLTDWTISLIDERRVIELVQQVDAWSALLKIGAGLFQTRDNPADNVQVAIKFDRAATQTFGSLKNYADLYDLAQRIKNDPVIPNCVKGPIQNILTLIAGQVVVAEMHGSGIAFAKGLHIYFPTNRKSGDTYKDYDYPRSRQTDGNSHLATYAQSHDQLPLMALDRNDGTALNPRTEWPEPPSPNLSFIQHARWSLFLERYYHPVADNHILDVTLGDATFSPTQTGGGECQNPMDTITVPVGTTVFFSGAGSSDADQMDLQPVPQVPAMPFFLPTYYFWDKDAAVEDCPGDCLMPFTVPVGSDAGAVATNNMDADRDIVDTTWDEKNGEGPKFSRSCDVPGTYVVTLITWDDNHTMRYHDTKPDAPYVHPQTDSQGAVINCTVVPTTFLIDQPPTDILVNETIFLIGLLKAGEALGGFPGNSPRAKVAAASGLPASVPNYPIVISTTTGTPPVIASGTTIPSGGSATIHTDLSGVFSLQFKPTAQGSGQITVKAPGGPSQTIGFSVMPAPAVTGVKVVTTPPGGQVSVGQMATVGVQLSGASVAGVPVNFQLTYGNLSFVNNARPFAQGLGTTVLTDNSGIAQVTIQGATPGPEQIIVAVGAIAGPVNVQVTGTPPSSPTGVGVLTAPNLVDVGKPATVTAIAVAGPNPFPGVPVTFQAVQGKVTFTGSTAGNRITVTTNASGQATATFVANDATPIQLSVSINGTQLSTTIAIPVRLPPQ
jgi:hypothetical protein